MAKLILSTIDKDKALPLGFCMVHSEADSQLKATLKVTIDHIVFRMEKLQMPADRRCLFHEYKEWLGENINDEVWALPSDLE